MIMTSLGEAYVEGLELSKESMHKSWGSHLGFWLLYIQSHFVRNHRHSWCLSRSEITTLQESVLYLFSHKCPSLSWTP